MSQKDDQQDLPVDPRKPPSRTTPGSHTTGGARDHRTDEDSEGPER